MNQTITAVYKDGILRPLTPLQLPENAKVKVTVETSSSTDPALELVGLFNSDKPLINNIGVSEEPDLYLLAENLGDDARSMQAWEIAPQRYRQGKNGEAIRIDGNHE